MTKPKQQSGTTPKKITIASTQTKVRDRWDRKRVPIKFESYTRTKTEFKDECNVNNIIKQYARNGVQFQIPRPEDYGYHTGLDFRESVEIVMEAQTMFDHLPSEVRTRFQNNPSAFLDFVQNPDNLEELETMGLMTPKPEGADTGPQGPSEDPPEPSPAGDSTPAET